MTMGEISVAAKNAAIAAAGVHATRCEEERDVARLERDRARDAATAMSTELVRTRRSVSFLRRVLTELADEVGLAEEDITGIVRAVKARDGAGKRVADLEREARRWQSDGARVLDELTAIRMAAEALGFLGGEPVAEWMRRAVEVRETELLRLRAQVDELGKVIREASALVQREPGESLTDAMGRIGGGA